jgi:SAM-dependent methyltransferase
MTADLADFTVAQALIESSYDEVPYISRPFAQTHPGRVAAVAALFSVKTAPIETAHVLELGCAGGGNLIPMAVAYPGARFIGIDLSSKQIEEARQRAAHLGLTNIEFRQQDIATFVAPERPFDFIICHGVYSWVPDQVREKILQICATTLSPLGVAYVSYNTLPGWRPGQIVRDAMMIHAGHLKDPRERLVRSREFINYLKEKAPDTPYGQAIRDTAGRLSQMSDDYVSHEFLEINNAPCTFYDFSRAATRHRLTFLAETDVFSMVPDNYGPELGATLRTLGNDNLQATEQYIDVFSGRTFRQTLLVPTSREGDISRNVGVDQILGLHFLGNLVACDSDDPAFRYGFKDHAGRMFKTRDETVKRAFDHIVKRAPGSVSVAQLIALVEADSGPLAPAARATLLDALHKGVISGVLIPTTVPIEPGSSEGAFPVALPAARSYAAQGARYTVNLRHDPVELGLVPLCILPLLDGTHDREAMVAAVLEQARSGVIRFMRGDQPITDDATVRTCAVEHVESSLADLARRAVLLPTGNNQPVKVAEKRQPAAKAAGKAQGKSRKR